MQIALRTHLLLFLSRSDPNMGGDNDGQEGGESVWPEFTVPGLISKEFKPNLPDIQGLRSDYCQLWNGFLVDLGEYTGNYSKPILSCYT